MHLALIGNFSNQGEDKKASENLIMYFKVDLRTYISETMIKYECLIYHLSFLSQVFLIPVLIT